MPNKCQISDTSRVLIGTDCRVVQMLVIAFRICDRNERRYVLLYSQFTQNKPSHLGRSPHTNPATCVTRDLQDSRVTGASSLASKDMSANDHELGLCHISPRRDTDLIHQILANKQFEICVSFGQSDDLVCFLYAPSSVSRGAHSQNYCCKLAVQRAWIHFLFARPLDCRISPFPFPSVQESNIFLLWKLLTFKNKLLAVHLVKVHFTKVSRCVT